MVIDITSYNKADHYPINHGYGLRVGMPTSIVVHSTEGAIGQTLHSAAEYLYASPKVSAHYLIGKAGEIIAFLDPTSYAAWHAGAAQAAFVNNRSIGVENLHAAGESWPAPQTDALTWLLTRLIATYHIPVQLIETHGQIAIPGPYDRKHDPTNWPYHDFIIWRDALYASRTAHAGPYGALARQDYMAAAPTAAYFPPGMAIELDDFAKNSYRHAASGIGFIAEGDLVLP